MSCVHKIAPALAVLVLMTLAGMACDGGGDSPTATPRPTRPAPAQPTAEPTEPAAPAASGKVVKLANHDQGGSGEYKFVPSEFTFQLGETVTFQMSGETEFHTFTSDELGIDESVDGGQTTTFQVTFDRPGTFEFICIPHEPFGMKGAITVK